MEEDQKILNLGVGTKEVNILKPANIKIVSINIKRKKNDGGDMKTPLAEIMCKHPDREELLSITKIKVIRADKVQVVATWVQLDDDGLIQKSSALANLMSHIKVSKLEDLYGKEAECVKQSEEDPYLCIKAY